MVLRHQVKLCDTDTNGYTSLVLSTTVCVCVCGWNLTHRDESRRSLQKEALFLVIILLFEQHCGHFKTPQLLSEVWENIMVWVQNFFYNVKHMLQRALWAETRVHS